MSDPPAAELRVLIVDAGSAAAEATADAFAQIGARIAICADDERMARVVERHASARAVGGQPYTAGGAAAVVAEADRQLGALDICIGFAPASTTRGVLDLDPLVWKADLDRSLVGAHAIATAAAASMAAGGGGSIVLVGSLDAVHAYPGRSIASTAMSGLVGLARALGVELAPVRVRVNVVLAGPMDTGAPDRDDPENPRLARTLLRSPMHRLGRPQETAAAIRFVAGPGAGFMTGQALRVDGGWASLNQAPDGMKFP